jgi:soluble lytic murein transglycosylase
MALLKRTSIALVMLAGGVIAASDPNTAARHEFMQAYAAVKPSAFAAGVVPVVANAAPDSAVLQAYMLYPYLQAARLQRALIASGRDVVALDQSIKAFLLAQKGSLAGRELRKVWLLDLSSRQQWAELVATLPAVTAGSTLDAELRCILVTAQVATSNNVPTAGNTASTPDATALRTLWLTANRLPSVCNAPFDWARNQQIINNDLIEQRARLALKAGNTALARDLTAMLPASQAAPLNQWANLIERPQAAIDALLANPDRGPTAEMAALQDGWARLARKDQDAAIERLPRLIRARQLNDAQASPYVLSLALALSWSRREAAARYFDRVNTADMTEQAHEWKARAALWAGDWQRAKKSILAMPEALRNQARWRYWLARAEAQSNQPDSARTLYQGLVAADDNYYAAMAAARLSVGYAPHAQPLNADSAVVQSLLKVAGMQRTRELLAVQLRNEATAEWNQVFTTFLPSEQLAAAQLAHEWLWYDQAVATTAKLGLYNDYEFLYPQPYDPEVNAAAKLSGLPADLIYGVMRQETLFRADALSSANARGLLQLLPQTARITARKFNMAVPTADDLFKPAINVPLGAVYLKSLVDSFAGQTPLALASYNAGPAAVRRWLPMQAMETDILIENVPYNETRAYVQRVLWHSLVFAWLRTGKPVDTQTWLAPLQP